MIQYETLPLTTDRTTRLFEDFEPSENIIKRLEADIERMRSELDEERRLRYAAEFKAEQLSQRLENAMKKRKRRTRAELEEQEEEYNPLKSNGVRKPQAAEPIRSYEDFKAIQDYFLQKGKVRDWMLWTVGVSLGLRVSDLLSLRMSSLLNPDGTFKPYIDVLEHKTSKLNSCLITPSVVTAVSKYLDSIHWKFEMDDYLFRSAKTKSKLCEEYGWKILSDAGKALNLPINIGSHSMRKSFANIAACVDKSSVDMNTITKIQGLLNHSDQKVTMRYLGTFKDMFDRARLAVSDFVLGKTDVHELVAGTNSTIDDVLEKLDLLESKMKM